VAETQEPAMAETQKTAMDETQEPVADIEMELQDSDAQTSFVFNKEDETQSAIHPVAETQEPATNIEVELQELETLDAAVAETQEPTTDLEIEEVETQDAATPPSSTNMAERPVTHSVAET
jgi:succinate dehydrogenase/fumarate reductase flavoprotein subunit